MKTKLEYVSEVVDNKDKEYDNNGKGKENIVEEDIIPELDPPIDEEPFLKVIKAPRGNHIEGIPLFNGKMDTDIVMGWIEGMKNNLECEGVIEAQKVRLQDKVLDDHNIRWKYIQDERFSMAKNLTTN